MSMDARAIGFCALYQTHDLPFRSGFRFSGSEEYSVTLPRWAKNEAGEKVRVQRQRIVRSWFFAQDGGFYVQCKYGSKAIALSKDGNAIFVKQLSDVKPVLETLRSATENGELDAYVAMAINTRKNSEKSAL